ncbi:eukaryotic translation initiation factor 2 subunit 2 [Cimex lectularius]|uniref:Eukaryotic translation initiation factor 2 subunit 2 n=1 Tax=Cimex lectularius TaxID=79782 RepID=A0A8I6SPP2_CIMLE|nr:eukaryotic translation initiation factor 2 subunit 2 [Cimex lectularius]
MAEDEIFDPNLKKKKKKKKAFDNSVLTDGAPAESGEKNETAPDKENQEPSRPENEVEQDESLDLESFGTKKKKKKKATFNLTDLEHALPDGTNNKSSAPNETTEENIEEFDLDMDFSLAKKKKKKKKDLEELVAEEEKIRIDDKEAENESQKWVGTDRDYTYDELLTRVFDIMRDKNPEMIAGKKAKFVMRPPQVVRIGTKKTSFANFTEICKTLHRTPKHLLDFLLSELGTSGSVDGNSQLIIKGRFQQKQIENVLRRYIKEYVTCHTCRSPDTILQKDTRLFFLQCESCGSRCSVASIKSGFQAVTGKRAAIRAKTT